MSQECYKEKFNANKVGRHKNQYRREMEETKNDLEK